MTRESAALAPREAARIGRNPVFRLLVVTLLLAPFALALNAGFPVCPSAGLFGLPCPGCGLTRATLLLMSGDFLAAFRLHPLVLPLAPLYFGAIAVVVVDYLRGPRTPQARPSESLITRPWVTGVALILLVLTFGLWTARFFGWFGGPVAVESYRSWSEHHAHPAP